MELMRVLQVLCTTITYVVWVLRAPEMARFRRQCRSASANIHSNVFREQVLFSVVAAGDAGCHGRVTGSLAPK